MELAACEDLDPRLITQKEPRTDGQGPRQKQHRARDSPHGPTSTNYCLAAERRYKDKPDGALRIQREAAAAPPPPSGWPEDGDHQTPEAWKSPSWEDADQHQRWLTLCRRLRERTAHLPEAESGWDLTEVEKLGLGRRTRSFLVSPTPRYPKARASNLCNQ